MFSLRKIEYSHENSESTLRIDQFSGDQGSVWALIGNSGSGKTTILNLLSGIISPQTGEVFVRGQNLAELGESERDQFRGKNIGIVFQKDRLLDTLTVEQNLEMAQFACGLEIDRSRIAEVLSGVEIEHLSRRYPSSLSEGERQRVGIARAVVNKPKLILADEPTASLDNRNAARVIELLEGEAKRESATLLIATHDERVKSGIGNVFELDGAESK